MSPPPPRGRGSCRGLALGRAPRPAGSAGRFSRPPAARPRSRLRRSAGPRRRPGRAQAAAVAEVGHVGEHVGDRRGGPLGGHHVGLPRRRGHSLAADVGPALVVHHRCGECPICSASSAIDMRPGSAGWRMRGGDRTAGAARPRPPPAPSSTRAGASCCSRAAAMGHRRGGGTERRCVYRWQGGTPARRAARARAGRSRGDGSPGPSGLGRSRLRCCAARPGGCSCERASRLVRAAPPGSAVPGTPRATPSSPRTVSRARAIRRESPRPARAGSRRPLARAWPRAPDGLDRVICTPPQRIACSYITCSTTIDWRTE